MSLPASIRNKNPGAMYPGPSSRKFGALRTNIIGGGHQIAEFPDHISGAAAQFDLLERRYTGITVRQAITKWSGGNHVESYLAVLKDHADIDPDIVMSKGFFQIPENAIPFARAMAYHEAGQDYPLSDLDWLHAHELAFPAKVSTDAEPGWLQRALDQIGLKEIPGAEHNPAIVRMFALCGHPEITDDETAWCAVFVGSCLVEAGYPIPPAFGDMPNTLARSYLRYGVPVAEKDVRPGDLRIEARGPAPFGHVGFVVAVQRDQGSVVCVAGNSANSVAYETKPLRGALGYRRPVTTKPVTTIVKESPSLRTGVHGLIMLLVTGLTTAWQGVVWAVTEAGDSVGHLTGYAVNKLPAAEMAVSQGQRLAALFAVPWPVWAGLAITFGVLLYPLIRQISQRRAGP